MSLMHIVTKRHLSRRAVLKGVGATIALPLLDAMVPALTAQERTAAAVTRRFGFLYMPQGVIIDKWTPQTQGPGFELSQTLKPLEPIRDHIVVISGLENKAASQHSATPPAFLTGVACKRTEGEDIRAAVTIDQVLAERIGQATVLPSLELATEDTTGLVGACDVGFSCSYINTISWRNATTPLPMEINPQVAFERLFGGGSSPEERLARMEQQRSLLDTISGQVQRLERYLGSTDRARMTDYLDNIREVERRIQLSMRRSQESPDAPSAPLGIPQDHREHSWLMLELMALAYQADITRIASFMMARDLSQRTFPFLDVTDSFHNLSHHGMNPQMIADCEKIDLYHVSLVTRFLQKLRETPDGDGTLLDHSLIVYGNGMSDGTNHSHYPLPVFLAGGAGGRMAGDRHIKSPDRTPWSNLLVSVLEKADVAADRIGDASGGIGDL